MLLAQEIVQVTCAKMWAFNVLFLCVLGNLLSGVYGQRAEAFFRKDYKYVESTRSFYKVHTLLKTWKDAKNACAAEGATLFYPEDRVEAEEVQKLVKKKKSFRGVFIGVSDMLSPGVYETVDGVPLTDIYNDWVPGEPTGQNAQNCVVMRRDLDLKEENCASRFPFVCKKTRDSLQWNTKCNMPNTDYVFNADMGKCYKFHLDPQNWTDAYAICAAEQSYLAIINSQKEDEVLADITAKAPKDNIGGDYLRGAVHLGFHNRLDEGWQTIQGVPLSDSGYPTWGYGQPDGKGLEKCGSMFYGGQLNDIGCERRMFFICENDIDTLSNSIDERFNEISTAAI